jgi:hypothetical protein
MGTVALEYFISEWTVPSTGALCKRGRILRDCTRYSNRKERSLRSFAAYSTSGAVTPAQDTIL